MCLLIGYLFVFLTICVFPVLLAGSLLTGKFVRDYSLTGILMAIKDHDRL